MTYIVHMTPGGIVARCRTPKETLKRVEALIEEGHSLECIYDSNTNKRMGLQGLCGRLLREKERKGLPQLVRGGAPGLGRRNGSRSR